MTTEHETPDRWRGRRKLWTLVDYTNKIKEFVYYKSDEAKYLHSPETPRKSAGQRAVSTLLPTFFPRGIPQLSPDPVDKRLFNVEAATHPDPPAQPTTEDPMTNHPRCPVCNHPATSTTHRKKAGVAFADCICPNEHLWSTHWLLPIVPLDPLPDQEAS